MEYNEYDDYGTGYEEAAEIANDRREEIAIHGLRYPDEAILAFVAPRSCAAGTCHVADTHALECLPF